MKERKKAVAFVQGKAGFVGLFPTMAIHERARLTVYPRLHRKKPYQIAVI